LVTNRAFAGWVGGGVIKESKSRSNQTSREKWRESDEVADKIRLLGGLLSVREQ